MAGDESSSGSDPSPSQLPRLILICDRFETIWRKGQRPRITEFLDEVAEPERTAAFRELVAIDLRLRQELGERPAPEIPLEADVEWMMIGRHVRRVSLPGRRNAVHLALTRYRAGEWSGASTAIEQSMQLRNGGDVHDWVILAMICWRKGDPTEARRWHDLVTTLIERQNLPDEDLRRLHDEATALLQTSPTEP